MNKKTLLIIAMSLLAMLLSASSFTLGFILNRSKKSYDFKNVITISKSENQKYKFLEPELSDYICALCDELKLDSDLAVARLMVENPEFDNNAIHKNDNGTIDLSLWHLNDRYLWTTFKERYWFDNIELDPFNWKHSTYIALHHMKYLDSKFKVQDDAIMAYNCGEGAVMNGNIPQATYAYLANVKNNYLLLKNYDKESETK